VRPGHSSVQAPSSYRLLGPARRPDEIDDSSSATGCEVDDWDGPLSLLVEVGEIHDWGDVSFGAPLDPG
jgi:hypothetical protein